MSATGFLAPDSSGAGRWAAPFARLRDRVFLRCAGENCLRRQRFWAGWVRKAVALEFDSRWYCDADCLHPTLVRRLHGLLSLPPAEKTRTYRIPIGLLLIRSGALSQDLLREALRVQRTSGNRRIGDCLREMGAITDQQLTAALAQQWGCPVFPLDRQPVSPSESPMLPLPLLESARAYPAHSNPTSGTLHIAFADRLDHSTLYAVEQMLGCRTEPCVASESAIDERIARLRRLRAGEEPCFDSIRDPIEMARIIASYSGALHSRRFAVARVASHVWVRFQCQRSVRDLLFRIAGAPSPGAAERFAPDAKAFLFSADTRKDGVSNAAKPS